MKEDVVTQCIVLYVFFCKQKTAYEMRISDWSSDVFSSDLLADILRSLTTNNPAILAGRKTHAAEKPPKAVLRFGTQNAVFENRSEERRAGKECVRTSRSRW